MTHKYTGKMNSVTVVFMYNYSITKAIFCWIAFFLRLNSKSIYRVKTFTLRKKLLRNYKHIRLLIIDINNKSIFNIAYQI